MTVFLQSKGHRHVKKNKSEQCNMFGSNWLSLPWIWKHQESLASAIKLIWIYNFAQPNSSTETEKRNFYHTTSRMKLYQIWQACLLDHTGIPPIIRDLVNALSSLEAHQETRLPCLRAFYCSVMLSWQNCLLLNVPFPFFFVLKKI